MRASFANILLAATCLSFVTTLDASAFELFGYKFGSDGITRSTQTQSSEDIPDPVSYQVSLQSTDEALTDKLEAASQLIEKQETPASGTTGLLLRARNDHKRLIAALYREGRYGGTVDITINDTRYDKIALDEDLDADGAPDVKIDVQPGPLFTFSEPSVTSDDGTAISLDSYGIVAGSPAYSQLVLDAEKAIISDYQKSGYALARIEERALEADHETDTLDVALHVIRGPLASLGQVQVSGAEEVDADFIAEQADIPVGETYSPDAINKATRNLRALGVFDSVIVKTADTALPDGTLPVLIEVKERKFKTIGAGVTVGNIDGVGLEGYWMHRNLFGKAESLRVEGEISNIGNGGLGKLNYNADIIFAKPGILGPSSTFDAKLSAEVTNPDAFHKRAVSAEVGLSYQWTDELSTRAGLMAEYARVKDNSGTSNNLLFSMPLELAYDKRDSKLDPSEGFYLLLKTEPAIKSDASVGFLKSSATVTAYQALDEAKRFVLAGKLSAGSVVGASGNDIPSDRRFYAGGGGSIRGYAFQAAGPRDSSNDPMGGRSFALASVEARIKMTDTIGLAAFVDTGGAFNAIAPGSNGSWYTGVGAGVRYLTPIGPLRLDVAVPLKKIKGEPKYGVYLGLGQAF